MINFFINLTFSFFWFKLIKNPYLNLLCTFVSSHPPLKSLVYPKIWKYIDFLFTRIL